MPKLNVAVLGSTSGTSAQGLFDAELVSLVVSNTNRCEDPTRTHILERAKKAGIEAHYIRGGKGSGVKRIDFEAELNRLLVEKEIDLIVMVGFMEILSKDFTDRWCVLNVHPSLLPKHAGLMDRAVHRAVLDAKDMVSGCTVHIATQKADDGPIIIQCQCPVDPKETVDTLRTKVQKLEYQALMQAVWAFESKPDLGKELMQEWRKTQELIAKRQLAHSPIQTGSGSTSPRSPRTVSSSNSSGDFLLQHAQHRRSASNVPPVTAVINEGSANPDAKPSGRGSPRHAAGG